MLLAITIAATCSLAPARGGAEPVRPRAAPSWPRPRHAEATSEIDRRLLAYHAEVARATVLVLGESCTGFVAEAPNLVVTAAHCIPYPKRRVDVRGAGGQTLVARLDRIDRDTDLALLRLAVVLPVVPLRLSERIPGAGDRLMFAGRGDRRNKPQLARVEKLDRCPSLPRVPNAVFTSVAARPGDSGAPLVDANLRVVALVHGGARCHIAAPVATLARQLAHERNTIFAGVRSPKPWLPLANSPFEGRWLTGPESPRAELWWGVAQRYAVDGRTES